jgi:uncharacterized ferritin-like protein (DUF455 family)
MKDDTVEQWALEYILSTSLRYKLTPPPVPQHWATDATPMRVDAPGRPRELDVRARAKSMRGLSTAESRARAFATFLHHELQAAELMAWAILAFSDAPLAFRRGLARIAEDEARHMRMYAGHIEKLGFSVGDFPVRDWFWERVPTSKDAIAFVAVMGLGLESANLEHATTFARKFREAGDEEGARVQERVAHEEIAHVKFGAKWFVAFAGALSFDTWKRALPPPLSPMLMRGEPINRDARLRAGQPETFIDELAAWTPGS